MKLTQNPSFQFFAPFISVAFLIFAIVYFTGSNKYLGAVDGYGWSNSFLLDRVFGFVNISIPRQYYTLCFVIFYFVVSVPLQEYVFRVLPMRFLDSKWLYIGITSFIFMICHVYYMQIPTLILTGGLGVLTGIDYWNNKNFWAICIVHGIFASMALTLNLA